MEGDNQLRHYKSQTFLNGSAKMINNNNSYNLWNRNNISPPAVTSIGDAWGPPAILGKTNFGTTPTPMDTTEHHLQPETEEDYIEYYQDKINSAHNRQLYPLQEDLADWINKTLDMEYLRGCNLLELLDNGVILWQLAREIQRRAEQAIANGLAKPPVPTISPRCFKTAAKRSFFSRDNMEKFILFCKKLGVHQHLLFESDDLVLQHQPRNVILCLMEVSRLAVKYGVEPAGLIKFEKEIEAEEESQHDSGLSRDSVNSWQLHDPPKVHSPEPDDKFSKKSETTNGKHYPGMMESVSEHELVTLSMVNGDKDILRRTISEGNRVQMHTPNNGIGDESIYHSARDRNTSTEYEWSRESSEDRSDGEKSTASTDDLDKKVQRATHIVRKQCRCSEGKCEKLKVKKVGEGRYTIAGRNVFIRLLKGRHMMVRVGGGWDTLENFLARHDPCQSATSRCVSRTNSPVPVHLKNTPNGRRCSTPFLRNAPIDSIVSR